MIDISPDQKSAVRETLKGAVSLLKEKGWTQGTSLDERGSMCLLGALHYASRKVVGGPTFAQYLDVINLYLDACEFVRETLREELGDDARFQSAVALWNDKSERTVDDVIDVLDKTIKAVEEE